MFPFPLPSILSPNTYPGVATGDQLDKIATNYGLIRQPSESDESLRARAKDYLKSYGYASLDGPDELQAPEPVCECGGAKLGFTCRGPGHSSWCPLA